MKVRFITLNGEIKEEEMKFTGSQVCGRHIDSLVIESLDDFNKLERHRDFLIEEVFHRFRKVK